MSDSYGPRERIRKKSDFTALYQRGRSFRSRYFTIVYGSGALGYSRMSAISSRKVGNAVRRNRARRRARELFRLNKDLIKSPWISCSSPARISSMHPGRFSAASTRNSSPRFPGEGRSMKMFLMAALRLYKKTVSPLLGHIAGIIQPARITCSRRLKNTARPEPLPRDEASPPVPSVPCRGNRSSPLREDHGYGYQTNYSGDHSFDRRPGALADLDGQGTAGPEGASSPLRVTLGGGFPGPAAAETGPAAIPAELSPEQAPTDAASIELKAENAETITVATSLYTAQWTNKGGVLLSWKLHRHQDENKKDLELVPAAAAETGVLSPRPFGGSRSRPHLSWKPCGRARRTRPSTRSRAEV